MKTTSLLDNRKYLNIHLLCKSGVRQQVLEYLSCNIVEERENGDFIIEMSVPLGRMWFSLLIGFGNQIEVLDPEQIKLMLREKAEEVLSIY